MKNTRLYFHWRDTRTALRFRTAVSLHSHTRHSREGLDFLPGILHRIPVLRHAIAYQERRFETRHGCRLDYSHGCWTPPLHEREALALERGQIANSLGLQPLVSLSDHDNIDAASNLQLFEDSADLPVSIEWSIPYCTTVFHVGVHNLPRQEATAWVRSMAEYTKTRRDDLRRDLLAALAENPEVLVVFNHPLWDFSRPLWNSTGAGGLAFRGMVHSFIAEHREWLHAIELNGLRPWAENREVMDLAAQFGMCLVSGGDRHGAEPNANLNLTQASNFAAFVDEIRRDGTSEILFMPQYRQPFVHRRWDTVWDVIREYPEHPGRVHWTDRFYLRNYEGEWVTFSSTWEGGNRPAVVAFTMALLRFAGREPIRSRLRAALRSGGEVLP